MRKPKPAALDAAVMAQLGPTDPLRLRLVAHDPDVSAALQLVRSHHECVAQAAKGAGSSPVALRAFRKALSDRDEAIKDLLIPAIEHAERRRFARMREPDCAALAAKVVRRVDGDRLLAVMALLRGNPHWQDPALWEQPEVVPYLSRAVSSYARRRAARRRAREADLPRGGGDWWRAADGHEVWGRRRPEPKARGDQRRSPVEVAAERRDEAAQRRRQLAVLLERHKASPALRRAVRLIQRGEPIGKALEQAGVPRSAFQGWVARVQRGRRDFASPARKTGRLGGVRG